MSNPTPEPSELEIQLRKLMNDKIPNDLEKQLDQSLLEFRRRLSRHPFILSMEKRHSFRALLFGGNSWNWLWTTGTLAVILLGGFFFFLENSRPTWAEVVKQFQSISFCHAVIYFKETPLVEPIQFELWLGQGGKLRIRYGSQVIFGEKGKILRAFDVSQRRVTSPHPNALHLVEILKTTESISLESVIQSVAGNLTEMHPVQSKEAGVVGDLQVFDIINLSSPEWVRIWTLKDSLLPILLRKRDPRDGQSVDVIFSYLDQQPARFFDPGEFAEVLKNKTLDASTLVYAFLKDPSGRPISSHDLLTAPGSTPFFKKTSK